MRFHDLRHTAATLMLRAGVDAHRVQRILRHASVTNTTGTYGHLSLDDLRDAVARIGPKNPAPFGDSLLADPTRALPAANRGEDSPGKYSTLRSEPPGDRTQDPRLKRPARDVVLDGKDSQVVTITRQTAASGSTGRQALAGFRKPFADSLLTVREVAAHLHVSTRTVYTLCEEGRLSHVRVLNAIRIEPAVLAEFVAKRR